MKTERRGNERYSNRIDWETATSYYTGHPNPFHNNPEKNIIPNFWPPHTSQVSNPDPYTVAPETEINE